MHATVLSVCTDMQRHLWTEIRTADSNQSGLSESWNAPSQRDPIGEVLSTCGRRIIPNAHNTGRPWLSLWYRVITSYPWNFVGHMKSLNTYVGSNFPLEWRNCCFIVYVFNINSRKFKYSKFQVIETPNVKSLKLNSIFKLPSNKFSKIDIFVCIFKMF